MRVGSEVAGKPVSVVICHSVVAAGVLSEIGDYVHAP